MDSPGIIARYEPVAVVVKAKIRGKIVIVDFVADDKNAYNGLKIKLKYLGKGVYHSYNDRPANDPKKYHFWKRETDNTKS